MFTELLLTFGASGQVILDSLFISLGGIHLIEPGSRSMIEVSSPSGVYRHKCGTEGVRD